MKSLPITVVFIQVVSVVFFLCSSLDAALHITEFMSNNKESIEDEDGDASDWIEIFNSGPDPINLDGYYLTDDSGALTKWKFPAIEISESGFLLIFASEKDRHVPESELHTNFKLSSEGEYLALVESDGNTIVAEFGSDDNPIPGQFETQWADAGRRFDACRAHWVSARS